MTEKDLNELYFEWMCNLVCNDQYSKKVTYHRLLEQLHSTEFYYILPMDGNRAEDGINLRYRFGRTNCYNSRMIASYLDIRPCSVLEMMIALSVRCEDQIMENEDLGDRTGQWFWNMIVSLGLGSMIDSKYDPDYVDDVLHRFMEREYERNGEGGLFTVNNPRLDMRSVDIWYQMNWYLDEIGD